MENNESIGSILSRERDRRGLSLDEVHEATKITPQNLSALEEDRFDHFPNRVYARAFLRDYANFLGLDSGGLLERYESEWKSPNKEPVMMISKRKSPWKAVLVVLLTLIVFGGLGAAGYYLNKNKGMMSLPTPQRQHSDDNEGAQLPKPDTITPPKPEKPAKPVEKPKPVTPAVPDKAVLEVTALRDVWVWVKADGARVQYGVIPKGATKKFEGKKDVWIRAAQPDGIALKLNGKQWAPFKNRNTPDNAEFKVPQSPVQPVPATPSAPAAPAAGGGNRHSAPNAQPVQPARP